MMIRDPLMSYAYKPILSGIWYPYEGDRRLPGAVVRDNFWTSAPGDFHWNYSDGDRYHTLSAPTLQQLDAQLRMRIPTLPRPWSHE